MTLRTTTAFCGRERPVEYCSLEFRFSLGFACMFLSRDCRFLWNSPGSFSVLKSHKINMK